MSKEYKVTSDGESVSLFGAVKVTQHLEVSHFSSYEEAKAFADTVNGTVTEVITSE